MGQLPNFVNVVINWMDASLWWVISAITLCLTTIGLHPLDYKDDSTFIFRSLVITRKVLLATIPILLVVLPVITYFLFAASSQKTNSYEIYVSWYEGMASYYWKLVIISCFIGFIIRFVHARYFLTWWSSAKRKIRVTVSREKPSDITEEKGKFVKLDFDPRDYYKEGFEFMGLGEDKEPIYIDVKTWYKKHNEIIGPTQYGKGVQIGSMIYQGIRRGDGIFYVDPKSDDFIPHIMCEYALLFNRMFVYVDLTDEGPGGYHPFKGSTVRNARARLLKAFDIKSTNKESGYYRAFERNVADQIFESTRKIKGLKQQLDDDEELAKKATKLHEGLKEWCQIESLNPKGEGVSIEKCLLNNAIVYVKGDLDDEVISKATKCFIDEIFQETKRLRNQRASHLSVFVDEMRFLTSEELAKRLATTLGFDTNMILSYQTKTDAQNLEEGSNVNPKIIESGIHSNAQLKFVYGTIDSETAEWIAKLSGTHQKQVTQREVAEVGHLGEETWGEHRTVANIEESFISENVAYSLPERVGVLFQPGELAKVTYTSFVPVERKSIFDKQVMVKPTARALEKGSGQLA